MCDESRPHGVGSTENLQRLGENSNPGVTAIPGIIIQGQAGIAATVDNQGVIYTAKITGAAGNGIDIEVQNGSLGQAVTTASEDVATRTVTIKLATDPVNGQSVATVNDVVAAVNAANLTLISASGSGTTIVGGVSWSTDYGAGGVTETVDLTVMTGASATGNITVKVAGVDHIVAVTAGQTANQVAAAIAAQLTIDQVPGYNVTNPSGAIVRFTSTSINTPVPDLTISVSN